MKRAQPWPGKENPIIGIAFELFVGFDEEGQPVYGRGQAHSQEELRKTGGRFDYHFSTGISSLS